MSLKAQLSSFYCTNDWYKGPFGRLLYTDGIKFVAEQAGAYWLIDAIASHQTDKLERQCDGFQVWNLKSNGKDKGAILTCKRDSGCPILVSQEIELTDFPLEEFGEEGFTVWVEGMGNPPKTGEVMGRVLLLPSEH